MLVSLAKDPIGSQFSGRPNECLYRKELFHRYRCIITLDHKLVTLLIANRQYVVQIIMEKTDLVQL